LKGSKIVWAISFSFILLFSINSSSVYAQSSSESINLSEWTTYTGESILTDPIAQKILENIEISKQILYDIQNPQRIVTEHELYIDQQRQIAQQQLQEQLDRMNKNNADKTPRAAFAKMVAKYPEEYHDYMWELFNYMYSKVIIAREARDNILANGGTHSDAQQAFIEHASITKAERIAYAEEMVDKYELYNKISSVRDFNNLPQSTKVAFINYMDKRGLAEYVVKPMFDKDPNDPTQETQIRIIDVQPTIVEPQPQPTVRQTEPISVLNSVTQVFELSAPESDNLIEFAIDEPISLTRMDFDGNNFETNDKVSMNSVSEFTLSVWVKPDYSDGSSEFTILSKEKAFKLTINNNILPDKVARLSVFDGFKWTTVQSYSAIPEKWTHIGATLDGDTINLFINGNQEASTIIEGIPTINKYGYVDLQPIEGIESDSTILYGAQQYTKNGEVSTMGFFSGDIDEVLIDNKKLSAFEIRELCTESPYFTT